MEETTKKKVLVVDDNENLTTVLVDKLNLAGYDVQGAMNGEEGLKKALEFRPEVILLDLVMPKMDGIEMLKKLRENEWGKEPKVVVLTLLDEADYIAKVMENNVYGYIIKTDYSLDGIVKKVEDTLEGIN